jgi:hypothetical protein
MTTATPTSTESRALQLLGQGLGAEMVASAVGVSVSRISQLLSETEFAAQVADLRFRNLSKHNERDSEYDKLEDELIIKMRDLMPFMVRPMEVARVLQIINQAKRRGSSAPESITNQQTVVQLNMPVSVYQKFTVNANNQVIQAGQQQLITVQSGNMAKLLTASKTQPSNHQPPNVEYHPSPASSHG